jgi:hypothetical protein
MPMNPIGQLTNYKMVSESQMATQKSMRAREDMVVKNNAHTNPSIKNAEAAVSQNTEALKGPLGTQLDLQTRTGAKNNQLNLLV